jgi:hypothetical protein
MAFDLGDPIPLVFKTVDAAGNPANVGAAVLTITLPDGTTTLPAVAAPNPVGTYQPTTPYISVQAGRHGVRWVGTGANAQSYDDAFDVLPAEAGFLFSLADARAICRIPAGDNGNDELIRTYIGAVTVVVEYLCGKQIKTQVTQTYDGGNAGILLPSNLISVDTVIEAGVVLTPVQDYTVDTRSCILYRGSPMAVFSFIPGIQNISVMFTKGNPVIPANVQLGAELILRHFWQGTQQGNRPAFGSPDSSTEQTVNVLGYLIPHAAMSFLKASPALAGFA